MAASCSDHGNSLEDFQSRTVAVDGKTFRFRVFVPGHREPNAKVPVMLYLHGSGTRGDDNIAQADGFNDTISPLKIDIDFIVVVPQCREGTYWSSVEMSGYALTALDSAVKEFNGDADRLYLAGYSLGGYGVWHIAAANPGKFAALVPVAGGVVGARPIDPEDRAVMIPQTLQLLESADPYRSLAAAIGQTPVWLFHGVNDDAVPVEFSRKMVRALADAGNDRVRYTEYENDGHFIIGRSFAEPGFLEWLREQKHK